MFIILYAVRVFVSVVVVSVCVTAPQSRADKARNQCYIILFLQSFLLLLIFYLHKTIPVIFLLDILTRPLFGN